MVWNAINFKLSYLPECLATMTSRASKDIYIFVVTNNDNDNKTKANTHTHKKKIDVTHFAVQCTPAQYAYFQKAVTPYLLHRHVFLFLLVILQLHQFWLHKNLFCDCKCRQSAYLWRKNLATKTKSIVWDCNTFICITPRISVRYLL